MSKPKLIVLSGSLGSGKSTLAKKYAENHPLALALDIDIIRLMLGEWRDHAEDSAQLSKRMAEEMSRINLSEGHDVIIPQIYRRESYLDALQRVADETDSDYFEIILLLDKEEAIDRFMSYKSIHPGGLIDRGGGVSRLEHMYDEMVELASKRPNTIKISPIRDDIEATYELLIQAISSAGQSASLGEAFAPRT